MAYRYEQNGEQIDLVIDGFERGIAPSPYAQNLPTAMGNVQNTGIADMRNMNIITVPGEASVNFSTTAMTMPPTVSAQSFTAVTGTPGVFTVSATTGFYVGMAIQFNTLSDSTKGVTTGAIYYVGNITSTTFTLYSEILTVTAVNLTGNISGTYSTITFGTPVWQSTGYSGSVGFNTTFILDATGNCWYINPVARNSGMTANTLQYVGNLSHAAAGSDLGIAVGFNYLLVWCGGQIDYISLATLFGNNPPASSWHYNWKSGLNATGGYQHHAIFATDNAFYFCNGNTVGSILQNSGSTFDPATSSTYTYNASALTLWGNDFSTYLAQLGTNLLIGASSNFLYPWDRVSPTFNYPIILSEALTTRIVATNSIAYIFCGNRGRIYQTNGANVQYYTKVPDYVTGAIEPYITWGDAMYWRNQIYFTMTAKKNDGTTLSTVSGVWAIDTASDGLRCTNTLSFGTTGGSVPVLAQNLQSTPAGGAFYAMWKNGNTYGIDYGSSTPYSNFESYLDTDLIPVGNFFTQKTFKQVEWKTSVALISGEKVRVAYRTNLSDSFTTIFTSSTAGVLSDAAQVNFQKVQWIQFRVSTASTNTTPSYVRLKELRLR